MNAKLLGICLILILLFCGGHIFPQSKELVGDDADVEAAFEDEVDAGHETDPVDYWADDIAAKFEEEQDSLGDSSGARMKIKGFVDVGWINPGLLADREANLRRLGSQKTDHHWGTESGNAQNTVNKLDARTFTVNEVSVDFDMQYNERFSSIVSIFVYPTTSSNTLREFSSLTRDQDIPRDAGPDGLART